MGANSQLSLTDFADDSLDFGAELVSYMSAANKTAVGVCGILHILPPHSVDQHIHRWSSPLGSRNFAIYPAGWLLAAMAGCL